MITPLPHRTSLTIPDDLRDRIHRLPPEILTVETDPSASTEPSAASVLREMLARGVAAAEAEAEVAAYNAAYAEPDAETLSAARARRARVHGASERALHEAETRGGAASA